jgi:hypothetical protein
MESSRTVSRSGLRSSGSAENGNTHRGATLILARGRIELQDGAVCSSTSVRDAHCIADRNAMVGRQDRARRFCQRAEYARRLSKRLFARQLLIVRRTIPVANDEQSARRGVASSHEVAGGHSSQQNLERERVSRNRGDQRSHPVSSIAPLEHETTPRQALV